METDKNSNFNSKFSLCVWKNFIQYSITHFDNQIKFYNVSINQKYISFHSKDDAEQEFRDSFILDIWTIGAPFRPHKVQICSKNE